MIRESFFLGVKLAFCNAGMSKQAAEAFTAEAARRVADDIGLDLSKEKFSIDEFRRGIGVEFEHGSERGEQTNVIDDDPKKAARIALAHLREISDYYTRLRKMEGEGK